MALPSVRRVCAALARAAGLLVVAGLAGLPSIARASTPADDLVRIELDVVFPRNETYKETEILPIALAVQNYTILPGVDSFSLSWEIVPYTDDGSVSSGIAYDGGYFSLANASASPSASFILVTWTNVTTWVADRRYHDRYVLQVSMTWLDAAGDCDASNTNTASGIMFSVETVDDSDYEDEDDDDDNNHNNSTTLAPSAQTAPDCPLLLSITALRNSSSHDASSHATDHQCPYETVQETEKEKQEDASPAAAQNCTYPLDAAAKASIDSRASRSATAAMLATQTTASDASPTAPTSTNAAAPAAASRAPLGAAAIAAVGVVYCWFYR